MVTSLNDSQLTKVLPNRVNSFSFQLRNPNSEFRNLACILNASNTVITQSAYANRFLFTGREWIRRMGIYDYRNRVYSPDLGRFLQSDPIRFDAGDVNMYRYVGNNAVNLVDPAGEIGWRWVPGYIIQVAGQAAEEILERCLNIKCKEPCLSCAQSAALSGVGVISAATAYSIATVCLPLSAAGGVGGVACVAAMVGFKTYRTIRLGKKFHAISAQCKAKPSVKPPDCCK